MLHNAENNSELATVYSFNFNCFLVSNDHQPNGKRSKEPLKFTSFIEKYNIL
jgi:hypothetical protein